MAEDLLTACKPLIDYLQTLAGQDATLRGHLRTLGEALLRLGADPPPAAAPSAPLSLPDIPIAVAPPPVIPVAIPEVQSLPPASSAPTVVSPLRATPVWHSARVSDEDLSVIAARCRLKAEAARWASTRHQLLRAAADVDTEIEPQDRELIARAKMLPDCFLWMCHRSGPTPTDLALYEELAGCFEAVAAAATLLDNILKNNHHDERVFVQALELTAEAQSALRVVVTKIGGSTDSDQFKLFTWLRTTGVDRQILIPRFMRRDDPAESTTWLDLSQRIAGLEQQIQWGIQRVRRQQSLYNKIRYHLKLINNHPAQERSYDWGKVVEAVEELSLDGAPPSNRELRDLLIPVLERIPETLDLPKHFTLVLREIDRYLAERDNELPSASAPLLTAEIERAATLLRGRTVVLIGGDRRPNAAEALCSAFGLKELIWIEGRDQTYTLFEPQVAKPDVAVVLLAIRWSRHGFGEVRAFCEKYNKPLVRLPGGYNPNQVANHIISQVADRLQGQHELLNGVHLV